MAAMLPAQDFVPLRTEDKLNRMADTLNSSSIGAVFSAYNPASGDGVLFGNDAAREALPEEALRPITGEAIRSALWLSLYGFDDLPSGLMDGAYHRSCIVAELSGFDRVIAVRPLAQGWKRQVPKSWFEVQDWQTEMWFSASFRAEVADMERTNRLLAKPGALLPGYKKVELITVSIDHPAGYFNYFGEKREVYDSAVEAGRKTLSKFARRYPDP